VLRGDRRTGKTGLSGASFGVRKRRNTLAVPAVIAGAGDHAARRFLEFFAANIRNRNTRMAYYRAVCTFFAWVSTPERNCIGGPEQKYITG
jgi:hypothetical protein